MMLTRLHTVGLAEADYEVFIRSEFEVLRSSSPQTLQKVLVLINKSDFLLNYKVSEELYQTLARELNVLQ